MNLTISIRFLTGRAHLHPWQTHHSEGRVEWPPSPWRLLRALVAVAGRGLTPLPTPDWFPDPGKKPRATKGTAVPILPREGYASLSDSWCSSEPGEIPLSRLASLLDALLPVPYVWLPKTSGGHTRQYFPIGAGASTGSAVFDTFATVAKNQPLIFHWPDLDLVQQQQLDLTLLLDRLTYFGRAESWCRAEAHMTTPEHVGGIVTEGPAQTHWRCVCIEDHGKPDGKEYRDYTLERRLVSVKNIESEARELLPRTRMSSGREPETFKAILQRESREILLLRCLLRESGQDIKDGLERPIGTRWIHYAVSRAIYDLPRPKLQSRRREQDSVNLVRYALNTTTVGNPVLPAVTDTLLVADRFRTAVMALRREPSRILSGHDYDGAPCRADQHAYWWPVDEDNDGFIDHVMVWTPSGFEVADVDALRRLTRLRQRYGRPDLLITPTFVGLDSAYRPWQANSSGNVFGGSTTTFVSATPYFCPVHLSHGRRRTGRVRPIVPELLKGLEIQGVIARGEEVEAMDEIVFDYAPNELAATLKEVAAGRLSEPVPPRQYFRVVEPPPTFPPLPRIGDMATGRFRGAYLKGPDEGFPFGLSVGLLVDSGSRFIRAMSFCRQRRQTQAKGYGRMFMLRFNRPRPPRPFAIGDQCHFGLGQFIPGCSE